MKKLALAFMLAAWCPFPVSAQAPEAVAFVGVNVVPMDRERVVENQTVIVRGGRIAEIGPAASVRVPAGTTRVDARGQFLLPGLSDMHGHLVPGDGTNNDGPSQIMKLYLANGVTTVRGMMGHPTNLVVRDKIARGEMPGPRIFAAGPPLNEKVAPTPHEGVKLVESLAAAGYDFVKIHGALSPETYEAVAAAAKRAGIRIAGHVPDTVGLDRALAAGQSSIEHLDGYLQALVPADSPVKPLPGQIQFGPVLAHMDESRIASVVSRTKDANVWNTPTLALFEIVVAMNDPAELLEWPEMQYVPAGMRDGFAKQKAGTFAIPASAEDRLRFVELRRHIVKALHDGGARLLVGPDTPQLFLVPGFATHREMQCLTDAGLSPFAALQAATTNAAAYLGVAGESGTVEAGKRADLLLVDADPLQDIANARKIAGVMVNGRWLPKPAIDRMLQEIASMQAAPAQGGRR